MKTLNALLLAATSMVLILAASSCSSSRKATSASHTATSVAETRYAALDSASLPWSDVNVPFTFSISSPTDFSISGRMKMIRGKAIDISLRLIGIEMARILVTPDSVFATYKLKKLYVAEPVQLSGYNTTSLLSGIQDLLTGRVFLPAHTDSHTLPPFSAFDSAVSPDRLTLTPADQNKNISCSFLIDNDNKLVSTVFSTDSGQNNVTVDYSSFISTTAGLLPKRDDISAALSISRQTLGASIDWKWNSARWNTATTIEWTAPRGYRKVSLNDFFSTVINK